MTDAIRTYSTLRAANQARQAEWDKDERISLSYRGNELAGETGEACNIIKKLDRERLGIRGSRATVEQLAEELADVLICVDLIAMAEGIDMQEAVAAKFNATSEKVGLSTRMVLPSTATPTLTPVEQQSQATRCACRGADDLCCCQNEPDAVTMAARAAEAARRRPANG